MTAALAGALTSCFTGIESTPAITHRDVTRRGAGEISVPGDTATFSIASGEAPSQWRPGKAFYVTNPRIGVLFRADSSDLPAAGDTLLLSGLRQAISVTGDTVTDIVLTRRGSAHQLVYRVNFSPSGLLGRRQLDIPYTVELSVVDEARRRMAGQRYYIKSSLWCDSVGNPLASGRKMTAVRVTDVAPGTESIPLRVIFTADDDPAATIRSVFMMPDAMSFDRTFSTSDPRLQYPDITDVTWGFITRGQVVPGMTRQECGLALGQPDDVDRGYGYTSVHERWTYKSGIYLIFTDGILTSTNR